MKYRTVVSKEQQKETQHFSVKENEFTRKTAKIYLE